MTTPGEARHVVLVQQGVWANPLDSVPLASAYLKAVLDESPDISARVHTRILNFSGGASNIEMANALLGLERLPDVLAFSVMGWNYRSFCALSTLFKDMSPAGWVVFGGPHVTNQGPRVFRECPAVDVVVNGEGEVTFRELVAHLLDGASRHHLDEIEGISYRTESGTAATTTQRARISRLDDIPSPYLSGALELTDAQGRFRYDVALMETNRGCPYKCSFCYWGGAVGQKVREFSRERVGAELELFGRLNVQTVVLCDANFGMLKSDLTFVEMLIETHAKYGAPSALETSWAKNKSKTFHAIVERMKSAGLTSSFTLALQTLDEAALTAMNRRNMKVNDWHELVEWLNDQGMDCYAELIWGAPGETKSSFLKGYDELSGYVSRIAVYPMLLIPNTDYWDRSSDYGIVSVAGQDDDFQYVLAHEEMTPQENEEMQGLLFLARVLAENVVLRNIWSAMRRYAGMSQSSVIQNLQDWLLASDDPAACYLVHLQHAGLLGSKEMGAAIEFLMTDPSATEMFRTWWANSLSGEVPEQHRALLGGVFEYDLVTRPISRSQAVDEGLRTRTIEGKQYWVREDVPFEPAALVHLGLAHAEDRADDVCFRDLAYLCGAEQTINSTNHEVIVHYVGRPVEKDRLISRPP